MDLARRCKHSAAEPEPNGEFPRRRRGAEEEKMYAVRGNWFTWTKRKIFATCWRRPGTVSRNSAEIEPGNIRRINDQWRICFH